jgi:hypothetical protein
MRRLYYRDSYGRVHRDRKAEGRGGIPVRFFVTALDGPRRHRGTRVPDFVKTGAHAMDEPLAELAGYFRRKARLPDQELIRLTAAAVGPRRQQQTAATTLPPIARNHPASTLRPAQMTAIDLPATRSHRGGQGSTTPRCRYSQIRASGGNYSSAASASKAWRSVSGITLPSSSLW